LIREHLVKLSSELDTACLRIAETVAGAGGRALLVGGCVRDAFFGKTSKDIDIEVFGLSSEMLEEALFPLFEIKHVGRSYGVYKVKGLEIDISLPRRESKTGTGHKGFSIESDPHMSHESAASRRDFTINTIAWDPLDGEVIDPFGGVEDIKHRILRHTGSRFAEDPLRVLRAMQLIARFELTIAPETLDLCKRITPETLSKERIFDEWAKLILRGIQPSLGLKFLSACGWIQYFPEIEAMIGCEQDPRWHPEGDVWVHTLHCLDAFAKKRIGDYWEDLVVGFAVLCHDIGKPLTTKIEADGRIHSYGHDLAGEAPTRRFLARMSENRQLAESVVSLVIYHLRPFQLYKAKSGDGAIRRLAHKVGRIDRLARVAYADEAGRPGRSHGACPQGDWLLERAQALAVHDSAPNPIMKGRHLIALGMKPGEQFKPILDACYEAQLDGVFHDLKGGLDVLRQFIQEHPEISIERSEES
tara:strand:- start:973 stop:2391 length:1419 start_codon:yes stop_codon:yes gene_type:complete